MVNLDEKDLFIINELRKNSRISFVKIASMLNISETAVRKRVDKLEKTGIIKNYSIEVDLLKMGYNNSAIIGIDVESNFYLNVLNKLKNLKEIKELYTSTGDHMIMLKVEFKSSEELNNFISKIENWEGVIKVCPSILMERLK